MEGGSCRLHLESLSSETEDRAPVFGGSLEEKTNRQALPIAPAKPQWQPGKATWCKKCQARPPGRKTRGSSLLSSHCMVRRGATRQCLGYSVVLYPIMLRYLMLCHRVWCITSYCATLCCIVSCYVISCRRWLARLHVQRGPTTACFAGAPPTCVVRRIPGSIDPRASGVESPE